MVREVREWLSWRGGVKSEGGHKTQASDQRFSRDCQRVALSWIEAPPFWSGSGAISNDPHGLFPTYSMPGITIN